jgi:hypothetical protein
MCCWVYRYVSYWCCCLVTNSINNRAQPFIVVYIRLATFRNKKGEGIVKGRGGIIIRFVRGVEIRVLCLIVCGVEIEGFVG